MTFISNFFGTYGVKVLLSFIPLLLMAVYLITSKNKSIKDEQEINKRYQAVSETITQKKVAKFIKIDETKRDIFTNIKAKMNMLGIQNKFENLSLICLGLFFISAIAGNLLIGAGPLLMIYFGCLAIATVYVVMMNKIDSKKKELREEFMSKIRDIAAHMSVGANFQTAISESLKSSKTSIAMARELETVRDSIYQGAKYSDAFMKMYEHLQIKEIKDFAQMCYVYEKTGGQFVRVIHSFEDSYKMKRKIIQENEVFEASMKSDQKLIVGVPIFCIVGFAVFMPSMIRGFYATFFGQVLGIFLISTIYAGSIMMSRFMKFGGDE